MKTFEKVQPYITLLAAAAGPVLGWYLFPENTALMFASFFFFVLVEMVLCVPRAIMLACEWRALRRDES